MQTQPQVVGMRSLPKKQIILTMAGVMMAMFLSSLDQTIVGTAMPKIIADLNGFTHYTWVTTAYIVTSAVVMPIVGKLTDMHGRKPYYIGGLVIFTLGSLLSGLSQSLTELIFFRGLQGIGAGVIMANTFAVIGDLFPPAERGKYQGLLSGVFGLSAILGPTLGGLITDNLTWHWIFFVNVPLGLLVITLFVFYLPHFRNSVTKHQIDFGGMALLSLTVVPLLLALSLGGTEWAWNSFQSFGLFGLAAIMAFAFLRWEARVLEPIIPLSLFKNRIVAISQIVVFFTAFGMFGSIIFIPLFFQGVLGVSATVSGGFLVPMMLGQVTGSFLSGQLLSRAGGRYRLQGAAGLVIMGIGMLLASHMGPTTAYGSAVATIIVIGFGLGITMPLYTIISQNAVPYTMLGVASSSIPFARSIGGAVGLAIFGSILNGRFATQLANTLPEAVKNVVPASQLNALAQNPQALVSPEAQTQLQAQFAQLGPSGAGLYNQLLISLKNALSTGLNEVFLIGFFIVVAALVAHLFIKEIPLRKTHGPATAPTKVAETTNV
jgi:EmrB/QacA subfamily drug resistance transporter